jgi:hypothetical protein
MDLSWCQEISSATLVSFFRANEDAKEPFHASGGAGLLVCFVVVNA